jgi:hypothetical protein
MASFVEERTEFEQGAEEIIWGQKRASDKEDGFNCITISYILCIIRQIV